MSTQSQANATGNPTGNTDKLGSAESIMRAIREYVRSEATGINRRRSIAENLNAGFPTSWWDEASSDFQKVAPYKADFYNRLKGIGHSNPSVAWSEVVLYAKQARGIVDAQTEKAAAKAAKAKGKGKGKTDSKESEGTPIALTPHQAVQVHLDSVQKLCAANPEDEILKAVREFVELAMQALGQDMRAELPKAA